MDLTFDELGLTLSYVCACASSSGCGGAKAPAGAPAKAAKADDNMDDMFADDDVDDMFGEEVSMKYLTISNRKVFIYYFVCYMLAGGRDRC